MYLLSKRGESSELTNIGFNNSTSEITAISSTGKVLAVNTKGPESSSFFLKFLKCLRKYIEEERNVCLNKVLVIHDNVATHRSK